MDAPAERRWLREALLDLIRLADVFLDPESGALVRALLLEASENEEFLERVFARFMRSG